MNTVDKIKKRIEAIQILKQKRLTEIQITRKEREQIPDKIKDIDGIKLVVVDKLGEKTRKDCFAYNNKQCSALKELYCENKECRFYRNDITTEEIEKDIAIYYRNDLSRR